MLLLISTLILWRCAAK